MYFITVVKLGENNVVDSYKVVGYVSDSNEADRAVTENVNNIFDEGRYQYAIISKVDTGFFPSIEDQQWYSYTMEDDYRFILIDKCDAPEGLDEFEPYIMG